MDVLVNILRSAKPPNDAATHARSRDRAVAGGGDAFLLRCRRLGAMPQVVSVILCNRSFGVRPHLRQALSHK